MSHWKHLVRYTDVLSIVTRVMAAVVFRIDEYCVSLHALAIGSVSEPHYVTHCLIYALFQTM
jgi:predicted urease superfamily metal-dependent hydrolase